MRQTHVEGLLLKTIRGLADVTGMSASTPLMEAGIDCLAATEFANKVRDLSGTVTLCVNGLHNKVELKEIATPSGETRSGEVGAQGK